MAHSDRKPVCLLLPGTDGTGYFSTRFAAALSPHLETRILSYPANEAMDYARLCEYLLPDVPADRNYILIAESFSGPLAILLAGMASHPPDVLILTATFAVKPWPRMAPLLRLCLFLTGRVKVPAWVIAIMLLSQKTKFMAKDILSSLQTIDPNVLRTRLNAVLDCDVRPQLAALDMPIMYIRGRRDRLIPKKCADDMTAINRHITVVEVDAPHFVLQDDPSHLVSDVIWPFIHATFSYPCGRRL
ncbi:alpha/beta hydrolase [Asticcacaulis sp. 201]|uniref:alpha/beta fold hydrolase n=1 Tax=Asticcacaulis sp. 201 TaxID=3028787 RepID=UPI0029161DC9|nr:alpha/beta hydrolase [Asticcacaulis sp. 201]MDV6332882.1 alpha/beta hydrolase [Asticcacaulis sp. 201]